MPCCCCRLTFDPPADAAAAALSLIRYTSLYKALSSEEPVERRKASACLSRIGRAVTAVQASEKEREADSNVIKDAVKPLLRFQPEAGGAVVDDSKGTCASVAVSTKSTYLCRSLPPSLRCCLMPGLFLGRTNLSFACLLKQVRDRYSSGRVGWPFC